jgi:hypothetical protein
VSLEVRRLSDLPIRIAPPSRIIGWTGLHDLSHLVVQASLDYSGELHDDANECYT